MKVFLILFILIILYPHHSLARVTPEDIVNSKKEAYQSRLSRYSPTNQQKLKELESMISEVNKRRTNEFTQIMERQGQILDEYQRRQGGQFNPSIENARYWLTYAHEAVAFQAAKIYIFELTSEKNIKTDANNLINQLQSDLNILRGKVIKSQNIIKELVIK